MPIHIKAIAIAAAIASTATVASAQDVRVPLFRPSLTNEASPTATIGFNWVFGQGPSVGFKLFSTDRSGSGALSFGLDYLFTSQRVRPSVGLAYLEDNKFIDLNMGFGGEALDFGLGFGPVDTSTGGNSIGDLLPIPEFD